MNSEVKARLSEKIEAVKKIRMELFNDYYAIASIYDTTDRQIKELMRNPVADEKEEDELWGKRQEARTTACAIQSAINNLGDALCRMGENVETFWGK
jgi:hypothetical protein